MTVYLMHRQITLVSVFGSDSVVFWWRYSYKPHNGNYQPHYIERQSHVMLRRVVFWTSVTLFVIKRTRVFTKHGSAISCCDRMTEFPRSHPVTVLLWINEPRYRLSCLGCVGQLRAIWPRDEVCFNETLFCLFMTVKVWSSVRKHSQL